MARPTPQERLAILERRQKVARRYLRGETQWEIARAFEVTQNTISLDLKALRAEWLKEAVDDRGNQIACQLAKIDETERQAWAAWSKSQENAETMRAKVRGNQSETERVSKGQAGDPRYLEIVLKCVARRCELLGLNATTDADDEDEAANSGLGALALAVRDAVARFRNAAGGEAGGGIGETPPLDTP